jgi:2-oxoglutarate ferredoxin oxidoreductase subunit alpha
MQEGIGYAAATETPIVIVNIQRAGPATGQASRVGSGDIIQAKWGSHGDYQVIALSPWSVQEMYDQVINAFNFAEEYRVPVIILGEEAIAHLWERTEVKEKMLVFKRKKERGAPPFGGVGEDGVPPMPTFGEGEKLLVTGSTHNEWGVRKVNDPVAHTQQVTRLHSKIMNKRNEIVDYERYYMEDATIVVVSYGFTARSALFTVEKLRRMGKKIGMIRLKTIWPFADSLFREMDTKVRKVFVPEMNMGQVAGEIMKYTCGEVITYSQTNGEIIHPHVLMEKLGGLL